MANKQAFEIPFSEVTNSNLAGKNEVVVEFASTEGTGEAAGKKKKKKATAGVDQLVEMRMYIPGTVKRGEGDDGSEPDGEAGGEELNAATLFYETLKEKAEIGEVAGDTYATFLDILFLTPRYDLLSFWWWCGQELTTGTEAVTTWICTRNRSVSVVRHTTTRFSMTTSKSSSCYQSQTTFTT